MATKLFVNLRTGTVETITDHDCLLIKVPTQTPIPDGLETTLEIVEWAEGERLNIMVIDAS